MKQLFVFIGIIFILPILYIIAHFFLFDSWACYSSKNEINHYIENHDTHQLKKISGDHETYLYLKQTKHVSIKRKADNQGAGHIAYYVINLNGKDASLFVKINHNFLPEVPKVKRVKLTS